MAQKSGFKPGQTAPKSGQYVEKGPRGGQVKEVTLPKGKTFPPTESKGGSFDLVDPTHNKSGRA